MINISGQVVGVVSSSIAPDGVNPGIGIAVDIPRINLRQLIPELDPLNPGNCLCFGIFMNNKLVAVELTNEAASKTMRKLGAECAIPITLNPKTEHWLTREI